MTTIRGIFEREKGSGVWWIRWTDWDGNKRREKAGRRSDAITLLAKRKTEKLRQAKLPETIDNAILFLSLIHIFVALGFGKDPQKRRVAIVNPLSKRKATDKDC